MTLTSARLTVLGFWISLVFIIPICNYFKDCCKPKEERLIAQGRDCGIIFFLLFQCVITYVWAWALDHGQWEEGFWHNVYLFVFGHGFWEFILGTIACWPISIILLYILVLVFLLPFLLFDKDVRRSFFEPWKS